MTKSQFNKANKYLNKKFGNYYEFALSSKGKVYRADAYGSDADFISIAVDTLFDIVNDLSATAPDYWVVGAKDYHQFDDMLEAYKHIMPDVKFEEVGFAGDYKAVFWVGEKPSQFIKRIRQKFNDLLDKNTT